MHNRQPMTNLNSDIKSSILDQVEFIRYNAARKSNGENRAELGQFMTPDSVAGFMARMFDVGSSIRLLDAGAGIGSLTLLPV